MDIEDSEIRLAYLKFKQYVYYDKTDLRLRRRLSEFECDEAFEEKLKTLRQVLAAPEPSTHPIFLSWLGSIEFRLAPKKVVDARATRHSANELGTFITNVPSSPKIDVQTVNYFFDGAIELQLIAVLWILAEGKYLDASLDPECLGSRLAPGVFAEEDDSRDLFKKYHEQYSQWRDNGIETTRHILTENRKSVAILGLDVQEYFYRVRIDWSEVALAILEKKQDLQEETDADPVPLTSPLLRCVSACVQAYRDRISPYLKETHPDLSNEEGVPIGFVASLVLANWYLKPFDREIVQKLRPAYYGRYVDDILLVLRCDRDPSRMDRSPVAQFMSETLVETGMLEELPEDDRYEIRCRRGLFLQQAKCILQYFDVAHSIAGLQKFKKKIERNASSFALLPVEEADNSIEEVAYELIYEGSVNKFRSVRGMAENKFELSKHLARQTVFYLLVRSRAEAAASEDVRKFFKGKTAIEFSDLWERVFTLFGVSGDSRASKQFERHLRAELKRVGTKSPIITSKLAADLSLHLDGARAMAAALCEPESELWDLGVRPPASCLRKANLLRHHFVPTPLLNFTKYLGALTNSEVEEGFDLDEKKLELSPRYVNFDECMLFAYRTEHRARDAYMVAQAIHQRINHHAVPNIDWVVLEEDPDLEESGREA